jgi:hypothetical protein
MPDEPTTQAAPSETRCPWCSAVLPAADATTCPSCGATLVGDGETGAMPGLTAIDADAILRNARNATPQRRGRLLGWISGDYPVEDGPAAPPGSLAPPPADVRREMLRLELEAQVANAQAEVEAMAADEAIADGAPIPQDILNQEGLFEPPADLEPAATEAVADGAEPATAAESTSTEAATASAAAPDAAEPAAQPGDAAPA